VTTSIIREYGARRNADYFFAFGCPRHSMDIINLCIVPSVPRFHDVGGSRIWYQEHVKKLNFGLLSTV